MSDIKNKLIKIQKKTITLFWMSIIFLLGFLVSIWQTWVLANEDVLSRVFPAIKLIIIVIFFIIIAIMINYIRIGKAIEPTLNNNIKKIEKLGDLKSKGLISEAEFKKEKEKILNN